MDRKKLPIGYDSFEEIRRGNFYYVDKTLFIRDLLRRAGKVNLFTRPRRFGKTLNMSMLKSFFEIGSDPSLFNGLAIRRETQLCEKHQAKHPVIFLSLKGVDGLTYADAIEMLKTLVAVECGRLDFLLQSHQVKDEDKQVMRNLRWQKGTETELKNALVTLMRMLRAHYGEQVILLIDEYDVPLDKAHLNGYYNSMMAFLRGFFGEAFKTNPDLYFAVVTGCLRISKESIFTGINNLKIDTITDTRYDEYFGFTKNDVQTLLADYSMEYAREDMQAWYDGYHFGNTDVYCPWDVINHCDKLLDDPKARPKSYWNNTSSNSLVRQFIDMADATTRSEIEQLMAGKTIRRKIVETLTYGELTESIDNLWSVLFLTGYLTVDRNAPKPDDDHISLVIPNREVREIFIEKIQKWFKETQVFGNQKELYDAIWSCDCEKLQDILHNVLLDTISYHDYHENYYHALLTGLLLFSTCKVRSNAEMGSGRSDIVIEDDRSRRAVIIEVKRSRDFDDMEADSEKGIRQIQENNYAWPYQRKKYTVLAYGIAFAEKDCRVKVEKM